MVYSVESSLYSCLEEQWREEFRDVLNRRNRMGEVELVEVVPIFQHVSALQGNQVSVLRVRRDDQPREGRKG